LGAQEARKVYRYLMPVQWNAQSLVTPNRRAKTLARQLIYAYGSSGEEQSIVHEEVLQSAKVVPRGVSYDGLVNAMASLDDGQSLLGWEPFVSYNNRNLHHKVIRVEEYRIGISMFCNESWLAGKRAKERLGAFVDTFVAAWNSCRFNKFEATLDLTLSPETSRPLLVSVSPDQTEGLARLVGGVNAFLPNP